MKKAVKRIAASLLSLSMILGQAAFIPTDYISFTTASIIVSADTSKLPAPLGLNAETDIYKNKITLSWKKVTGASMYNVYKYNSKTKKYEKIATVQATSYVRQYDNLEPGNEYKFRVSALKKTDGEYIEGNKSVAITVKIPIQSYTEENIEYFALPYLYNELTDDGKEAYIALRKDLLAHKSIVKIKMVYPDCKDYSNFFKIKAAVSLDPLLMGYLDDYYKIKNKTVHYNVIYEFPAATQYKLTNECLKAAKEIADKVKTYTAYNKILYIHDYITTNCVYNYSNGTDYTAYGCLVNKEACCEGITHAFSLICAYAGIDAMEVAGDDLNTADDYVHVWNKVKYNGKWYNIDVTWDLISSFRKVCNDSDYNYFMISDDTIKKDHIIDDIDGYADYPPADDDSKSYYAVKGLYVTDISNIDNFIYNKLLSAAENGEKGICFNVSSDLLNKKIYTYLEDKDCEKFFEILSRVIQNTKTDKQIAYIYYPYLSNTNTIMIYLFYEDTPLTDYFTEEEIAALNEENLSIYRYYGIE